MLIGNHGVVTYIENTVVLACTLMMDSSQGINYRQVHIHHLLLAFETTSDFIVIDYMAM